MSSCREVECSKCGAESECVTKDCINNGGDMARCCYCLVEEGELDYADACDECKTELDELVDS